MAQPRNTDRGRRNKACPNCGEVFSADRLACPECGSDENTGWKDSEEIAYQSVDIPDFYEDPNESSPGFSPMAMTAIAVLALLAFVLVLVLG